MEFPATPSKMHVNSQQDGYKPQSPAGLQDKDKPGEQEHSETGIPESNTTKKKQEIGLRLLPIGVLLAAFALWGTFGKIPNRAQGRAVILMPQSSIAIQPREGGRLLALNIRPGEFVRKGQVLAVMEFPELETELQDKRDRLADLKAQNYQIGSVEINRSQLNTGSVISQTQANLRQVEALQVQLHSDRLQQAAYLDHLNYLNHFQKSTSERLAAWDRLASEGVIGKLDFIPYLYQFNQQEVANSINRMQVELDRLIGTDEGLRSQIQSLMAQNRTLATQKRQTDLQDLESDITRYNAIADQRRDINTLQARIRANRQVVSLYDANVEEISVNPGEVVPPGGGIGRLEVSNPNAKANVVALFKVGDAKRLAPGMEVEVIPDLYDRGRYGGIVAKVVEVAQKPVNSAELSNLVGSQDLAEKLLLGRDKDDRDKPQPVNTSVTRVTLELQTDPNTPSGLMWTEGKGAPRAITDGTTSDVRAVVDQRSLFSYLTPAFRWITGIYGR